MEIKNEYYTGKLRVRVCGVCLQNNAILLVCHRGLVKGTDFWAPPGGGLAYGETVRDCLKREFAEETGLEVKPGRFLFLNEFLRPPLHALELFFQVEITGGTLKKGTDPEHSEADQIITEVSFKTFSELSKIPLGAKHSIFHELVDFDDLFIPQNRFL
ncbi:NUDIX domain-containing protein [Adhaeribacter soli]|uniref:NUDIX hydrolase n=1 Tax=Adhaeribacter soli TaxID=2607655 RepID=A0A5N1JAH6_9BACT|nr:NUDIX hydrolase [Adhaeribacter soli]KAA9346018.1 NUDIX hydrolase [Adhaeribacter soli]